jgi:hypothetical protein
VSYEDPFSAASAVEWFNNKEWKGMSMFLQLTRAGGNKRAVPCSSRAVMAAAGLAAAATAAVEQKLARAVLITDSAVHT